MVDSLLEEACVSPGLQRMQKAAAHDALVSRLTAEKPIASTSSTSSTAGQSWRRSRRRPASGSAKQRSAMMSSKLRDMLDEADDMMNNIGCIDSPPSTRTSPTKAARESGGAAACTQRGGHTG